MNKDYAAIAQQYALDVVSGTIPACRWIKLAAQRHLDDLVKSSLPDYPYSFNLDKANRVCKFAELLPHVKGRWSVKKQTLVLQPWQCFVLCNIFGWLRKHDGLRRFRTALLYIPRKNGKSFLSSVVGLYMLAYDNEAAAEVLCGATTQQQAEFVFRPAQQMVEKTTGLRKRIQSLANSLQLPDGSKMTTVCGQPPDGSSPSCALLDESHEWPNDLMLSTMLTGMGAREQPLTFITTTAGYDTMSPAKLMQDDLQDVLLGVKQDEELFGVIYTIDEGDEWTSEIALRKANPNLDVSTDLDKLQSAQNQAKQTPRKQTAFKTKHCNIWCNTAVGWMSMEKWAACEDRTLNIADFKDSPCWAGLDLANKLDLTAYVLLFTQEIEGKTHYYLFPRFYLPEARINDATLGYYKQWEQYGYLEATPGEVNTHEEMLEQILLDSQTYDLREVGHDQWNASQLVAKLIDNNVTCVDISQGIRAQTEPMKTLEALVYEGRLHHNGNPVMTWCIANTVAFFDANDNVKPVKVNKTSEKKIDGTVATIMAVGRATLATPKQKETFGFLFSL